jgi:hypothetical protein
MQMEDKDFLTAFNEALIGADLSFPVDSGIEVEKVPIVYVVGAPRSGTTLLSQLLCRYLPVGYINNFIARFWLRPSAGIMLSRIILGEDARKKINFRSLQALTEGPEGPHEFGYFWRRWLKLDDLPNHHLSDRALAAIDRDGLRRALEKEIIGPFGGPVVFKNIICGFHADFLTKLHPASIYVYIKRNPHDVVNSILKCRKERLGTYEKWWSLKPSTYPFDDAKNDPVSDVMRQVADCRREMEGELALPGIRSLTVEYEEMCKDPRATVEAVRSKISEMWKPIEMVDKDFPRLAVSSHPKTPDGLEWRWKEYESYFSKV